ncbi:MAG: carbohydrate kinase family protein [Anaerolineales bacterium]|nr:carbohydrate kinase family protein [Anaerolineales bacterium]
MKIGLTGSIAFDYLMTFPGHFGDHFLADKLESISLSFLVDKMIKRRGGIGPNIGYTMAMLGGSPILFGTVGQDFEEYRSFLEKTGVDTSAVKVIEDDFTASFFATTDYDNCQIASFYPGAMSYAGEVKLSSWQGDPLDLVVISPTDPEAMIQYVEEAKALDLPYLYDPSQQTVRLSGEELRQGVEGAYALFVNEYEFSLIEKHTGMSLDEIKDCLEILVITRGESGSKIITKQEELDIPAVPPKEIIDPTGIGDAYRGGFLTGYSFQLDLKLCGEIGALAAAYCLEVDGPQSQHYTRENFIKRFREHFDDQGKLDVLLEG